MGFTTAPDDCARSKVSINGDAALPSSGNPYAAAPADDALIPLAASVLPHKIPVNLWVIRYGSELGIW